MEVPEIAGFAFALFDEFCLYFQLEFRYLLVAFNLENMQIILNKDVPKLGYRGTIVRVRNGYFRNFLEPNGLAVMATPALLKIAGVRKERMVLARQELIDNAKKALSKIKDLEVVMKAKVTSKGKLYGAITEEKVIDAILKETNVKLEKDFIKMEHIKAVGEYEITIHLGPDLEQKVKVVVKAL